MEGNDNNEENNSDIASKINSYEELIKINETKYEEILQMKTKNLIIKIANDCAKSLKKIEKNENDRGKIILKNYSLLISLDKVCPFKENKIFDSKQLKEIFDIFKNEFFGLKNNNNNQDEENKSKKDNVNDLPKSEQIEKRLEFLKFFIKILGESKEYNILIEILIEQEFFNIEQKKQIIKAFIDEFKEKKDFYSKEEINFYEFLIMEFNYLKNNLEYKAIKNEKENNYKIKLNKLTKKLEDIECLDKFIVLFFKEKDKNLIKEMEIFIFSSFSSYLNKVNFSTLNLDFLFKKCEDFLNESFDSSNIINLCKYIINYSDINYILKAKSLSSLSKKTIFKFTISFKDKKKDLYFYGNTSINEINKYLNDNLKDFKNNHDEFLILENKNNNDEFYLNKTLNELKKEKLEIISKKIIKRDELVDSNNKKLTEKFKAILEKWFYIFSKGQPKMNKSDIANCFNKMSRKEKPLFTERSMKVYRLLKFYSKSYEGMTLEEFKTFYEKSCDDKIDDVINNIRNMNYITEAPQEINDNNDLNKFPRYYLSNKVREYYLFNTLMDNFKYSLNEDIFDFMSFLSVNEEIYNNILNNFNTKEYMKFTKKNNLYLQKLYYLYIIESIIEDVEINNNTDDINDNKDNKNQKEIIRHKDIPKFESLLNQNNFDKKIKFFIDFIKNNYSDLVAYTSSILEKLNNNNKEENDNNKDNNNNNIIIRSCIKCLNIINNIYNSYHNINPNIVNNNNIINIKYKSLKNIIEKNQLSNNINDKTIYKEIISQIIKCIDKYCYIFDNKNQGEINEMISILNQNCYILLFSLLYTNKEIFEIIKGNKDIYLLFDKALKTLYLIENNTKINFRFFFISIFKHKEDKISDELLLYLIDLLFQKFHEYIKSDKTKIENNLISFHLNLLLNYCSKKENLKTKFKEEFKKIFEQYNNFNNNKNNNEKINGEIFKSIIQEILEKSLEKIENESFKNELKNISQGKKIPGDKIYNTPGSNNENTPGNNNDNILNSINENTSGNNNDNILNSINENTSGNSNNNILNNNNATKISFDDSMKELKSNEEKKISEKKEKYNNIDKLLTENKNIFIPYELLKENMNKINQDKIITNDNNKEKDNLKGMISNCSEFLNSKDENNKNLITIIKELKEMKETEDKEKNELLSKVHLSNNNKQNKKKRIKKKYDYAGLRNVGSYCYLNSVVQQLFYISQFKFSIMNADDKKEPIKSDYLDDDNILHQLQRLFVYLSFTSYGEVIPDDLVKSIKDFGGTPIGPNMDSLELYSNLCDKIEESLKGTKNEYLIKNLFIGKICHKNTCSSCNNYSLRYEEFKNISLEVKEIENIYKSLDKYISSEDIEDYNCSFCNKKVTMKRNTLLSNLPNILIIHLNRIMLDFETNEQIKINSRFEFPIELELKNYCLENNVKEGKNIYEKKDEYYKYELRGVVVHKGDVQGGHYVSIIKVDKDKWYEFNDSIVKEFDIKNLEEECFGGVDPNKNEEKKNSAYLLIYELLKKKPIKIKVEDKEGSEFKEKNNDNTIAYGKNNVEEIEEKYDITKLKDAYSEEELFKKMFYNSDEYSFYKYIPYNEVQKEVNKAYFSEVFNDNKAYDYIHGSNRVINFNNSLIQILTETIENESFNIINKKLKSEEYKDLLGVLVELIISYFSDDNMKKDKNGKYIKIVNDVITKVFLPLFKKENENIFKDFNMDDFILLIKDNLFSSSSIKLIFLEPVNKEICDKIYELFLELIKKINVNQRQKLNKDLNRIINKGENLSPYIFKMLYELIKDEHLSETIEESFLVVYYRVFNENEENKKEILKILENLICKKKVLEKSEKVKKEFDETFNIFSITNLLDSSIDLLILIIKGLQINNEKYSQLFNINYVQQLYTYCTKDEKLMKEKQIKLIKLIIAILTINDKSAMNRIKLLMGYPTLVFKKNIEENISLFGVDIMKNDINTEIFEYISYNQIKKERCLLSFLFPSRHNKNENKLDENDRNDLIYELINNCFGLNEAKEGSYMLFKVIYLMQSRCIKYNNLYEEIKEILKNANKNNNNKYDITKIEKAEKECIELMKYETDNENYIIEISQNKNHHSNDKKYKTKPKLSEVFKSSESIIDDNNNKEYIGNISNFIPHEIGKIKIILTAANKNMSIFRFEYFTTFFTKKQLTTLSEENKEFKYENVKRGDIAEKDNNEDNKYEILKLDFSILKEKKNELDFLSYINEIINYKNNKMIVIENKDVLNKKIIKSSLVRYYLISKNKNVFKIEINKKESNKDILNNFYLPDNIHNLVEENGFCNLFNVYRIKNEFRFLAQSSIGINIKTANAEKYIKDNFE